MAFLPRSCGLLLLLLAASCGGSDDAGEPGAQASVSISAPDDGATVASPFQVTMEAAGFTIEPAGDVAGDAGHFHLIVDAACVAPGEQIPADEAHIHLADGASGTELTLPEGEHTLCLQAGDGRHAALALTDEITVTVAGDEGETLTYVEGRAAYEVWEGTYEGEVLYECEDGAHFGALEADVEIVAWVDGPPLMIAIHTVTGSCLDAGSATGEVRIEGERTASGFVFPSTAYGVPGSFTLRVNGDRLEGRLRGEVADKGAGELTLVFDLQCTFGC